MRSLSVTLAVFALGCVDPVVLGGNLPDGGRSDAPPGDAGADGGADRRDAGRDAGPEDAGPPLRLAVVPEELRFVHVTGVTACPQPLGTVVLSLAGGGDEAVAWSVLAAPSYLTVVPTAGTLTPGRDASLEVLFNCFVRGPAVLSDPVALGAEGAEVSFQVDGQVVDR